jgi:hypothetical protein
LRTVISVAAVFAYTLALDAQIIATLKHLPDGFDEVRIRNNSAISLIAFAVTVKQTPLSANTSTAPLVVYSDSLIELANKPLEGSEERLVIRTGFRDRSGKRYRLMEEPIVTAGIHADGSTTGDAALLTRLIMRRSNMLSAVETALDTLSNAGRHNVPRDQLIDQFRKLAIPLNRYYLSAEQQVGRSIYQSIIGKLMHLPQGEVGTPFPPANFVAQETAALNRQRVILLESQPSLVDAALVSTR